MSSPSPGNLFRWLLLTMAVMAAAAAGTAGWLYLSIRSYAEQPADPEGASIKVEIEKGTPFGKIVALLAEAGVIERPKWFYYYGRLIREDAEKTRAGEYELSAAMPPREIMDKLVRGDVVFYRVTVHEGANVFDVAALYERAGLLRSSDFLQIASDANFCRSLGIDAGSLEGYLFPETYFFAKGVTALDVARAMIERFNSVFNPQFEKAAAGLGLSRHAAVTLASIVEKETAAAEERPRISAVFHNRLLRGMKLQTDPSVIYAILLERGSFNGNLTRRDLETPLPYNTYTAKGLPPGPIANPGLEALKAALYPQPGNDLYFVSRNDGTHEFCPDLKCHNRAVEKWQKRRR